ncbi:MAG: hypothetical protein GY927_15710 [bacterium]|nr:hypothetical protein [bacterium]
MPDTASSPTVHAHLTACHALCIARQGSRRHPWRKSRPLQAGAKPAPDSDRPSLACFVYYHWLRSLRSASCFAVANYSFAQVEVKRIATDRQKTTA